MLPKECLCIISDLDNGQAIWQTQMTSFPPQWIQQNHRAESGLTPWQCKGLGVITLFSPSRLTEESLQCGLGECHPTVYKTGKQACLTPSELVFLQPEPHLPSFCHCQ